MKRQQQEKGFVSGWSLQEFVSGARKEFLHIVSRSARAIEDGLEVGGKRMLTTLLQTFVGNISC